MIQILYFINFFRVLRDEEYFKEFSRLVLSTPYSREEWELSKTILEYIEKEMYDQYGNLLDEFEIHNIVNAYHFFIVMRGSFSGNFASSWSSSVTTSRRGMSSNVSKWLSTIDRLPDIHDRLLRVQIEHQDFRTILQRYDDPEYFRYHDPPYIHETRSDFRYPNEMSDQDHRDLVQQLLKSKSKDMLSGYKHPIYSPLEEAGWKRIDFEDQTCWSVGRTRVNKVLGEGGMDQHKRTESIWINYELE